MGDQRPDRTEDLSAAIWALTRAVAQLSVRQEADEGWVLVSEPAPSTPRNPSSSSSGYPKSPAGALPPRTLSHSRATPQPIPSPPPVSAQALFLVRSLRVADRTPRATRAWDAGYFASLVLEGRIRAVPPTPTLSVRWCSASGTAPVLPPSGPIVHLLWPRVALKAAPSWDTGSLLRARPEFTPWVLRGIFLPGHNGVGSGVLRGSLWFRGSGFYMASSGPTTELHLRAGAVAPRGFLASSASGGPFSYRAGRRWRRRCRSGGRATQRLSCARPGGAGRRLPSAHWSSAGCAGGGFQRGGRLCLRRAGPVTDGVESQGFAPEGGVFPDFPPLLAEVRGWLQDEAGERLAFYSAVEEEALEPPATAKAKAKAKAKREGGAKRASTAQLQDQIELLTSLLPQLSNQVTSLASRQQLLEERLAAPPQAPQATAKPHQERFLPGQPKAPMPHDMLRALTGRVGPPPRAKDPAGRVEEEPELPPLGAGALEKEEAELLQPGAAGSNDPMTTAVLEQSRALTQLVSHLVSADGLSDVAALGSSGVLGLGMRGAAKRERLQQELATGSGQFLLQVAQQACRRLSPTEQVPTSLAEACRQKPSLFTTYVERTGGYGSHRDAGLVMWILANLSNALLAEDVLAAGDLAALAMVALEQSVIDNGRWDVAYLLSLLEDPPSAIFAHRPPSQNPRLRAFGPLCPQGWATTAMTYVKEVDGLASRRAEATSVQTKSRQPEPEQPKSGKRRFPRKPKDASA